MFTMAGRLVGGGNGGKTLMVTGAEVVDRPAASVANAVKTMLVAGISVRAQIMPMG